MLRMDLTAKYKPGGKQDDDRAGHTEPKDPFHGPDFFGLPGFSRVENSFHINVLPHVADFAFLDL
jgi:hypothetical protein